MLLKHFRVEDAKLQHIPGIANRVADYLSRPSTWGSALRPAEIKEGEISQSQVRDAEFCPLPPPGLRPELWGADSRRHASRAMDVLALLIGRIQVF